MGYSNENLAELKRIYSEKRAEALRRSDERKAELHERFPEIKRIDSELANTGVLIMREIMKGKEGLEERLDVIRQDNDLMIAEREKILERNGYPKDYSDIKYECEKCNDTGYVGINMCPCLRFQLSLANMESSGLGRLLESQNFDTFSLKYFEGDSQNYSHMSEVLNICVEYADEFDRSTRENLLLSGNTGLGKTHLSTSIAGVVIGKGYEVVYESAQNIFDEYSADRFGRTYNGKNPNPGRFMNCDLLIIDDLGAELTNNLTVSCLYNIINTRANAGKPIIINTNCDFTEIRKLYGDRIYSRIMGQYTVLRFFGKDVRMQKLAGR